MSVAVGTSPVGPVPRLGISHCWKWVPFPLHVWIDNEVFIWEGLPSPERLPNEFLVDYVRVWQ